MPQSKITLAVLAFTAIALLILGGLLLTSSPQAPEVQTEGSVQVGGPYTLVTHEGKSVSEQSFLGAPQLIFFGFTYCPDVCPLTLEIVGAALDLLGDEASNLQPLFVSVDPERDTVAEMEAYLSNFHPRITGLTGTSEQVKVITRAYHVYVNKQANPEAPQDYMVDHSSLVYLMDEKGQYLTHLAEISDPTELAGQIRAKLKKPR